MSKTLHALLASAVVLGVPLAFVTPAHGVSTPIAGPGSYSVGATTSAQEPDLAGTVLADRLQPFTINGSAGGVATGTIQERVVRSDDTGLLHFYSRVLFDQVSGFEAGSYVEWLNLDSAATGDPLAVGRRPDGVGSPTSSLYDLAVAGQSRFDFNLLNLDPANAGFSTQFHYLKTDAANYALTGQLQLTGFEFIGSNAQDISSAWLPTWAPALVPEPESWAMMIAGFGLLGVVLRRARPEHGGAGRRGAAAL